MRIGRVLKQIRNAPSLFKYTRVSFAQYGEDLILSHMGAQRRGFYVDVGAYQPESKSNTYKLYLNGWSGITIEPNPDVAASFKKVRPRDTHLTLGVSKCVSELTYYRFAEANFNSFSSEWAERFDPLDRLPIQCVPLTDVLDRQCRDRKIDLLSIDCEGHDMEVIESLDWSRYRPTVVIIEDFAQFSNGAFPSRTSPMRSFMLDRDYVLASQTVFSFFYVDRAALSVSGCKEGFSLGDSQLRRLTWA